MADGAPPAPPYKIADERMALDRVAFDCESPLARAIVEPGLE